MKRPQRPLGTDFCSNRQNDRGSGCLNPLPISIPVFTSSAPKNKGVEAALQARGMQHVQKIAFKSGPSVSYNRDLYGARDGAFEGKQAEAYLAAQLQERAGKAKTPRHKSPGHGQRDQTPFYSWYRQAAQDKAAWFNRFP